MMIVIVILAILSLGLVAAMRMAGPESRREERMKMNETKWCDRCGAPYVGAACPNCGSRETEESE